MDVAELDPGFFHFSGKWVRARANRRVHRDVLGYMCQDRERNLRTRTRVMDVPTYMLRALDLERAHAEVLHHEYRDRGSGLTSVDLWLANDHANRCRDGSYKMHAGRRPRLGVFITASIPYGVDIPSAKRALSAFLDFLEARFEVACEAVIHDKGGGPDHAHIFMTDRIVDADGVGPKIRTLNGIAAKASGAGIHDGDKVLAPAMESMRVKWAELMREIAPPGCRPIDSRSHERRSLGIEPVYHEEQSIVRAQQLEGDERWRTRRARELTARRAALTSAQPPAVLPAIGVAPIDFERNFDPHDIQQEESVFVFSAAARSLDSSGFDIGATAPKDLAPTPETATAGERVQSGQALHPETIRQAILAAIAKGKVSRPNHQGEPTPLLLMAAAAVHARDIRESPPQSRRPKPADLILESHGDDIRAHAIGLKTRRSRNGGPVAFAFVSGIHAYLRASSKLRSRPETDQRADHQNESRRSRPPQAPTSLNQTIPHVAVITALFDHIRLASNSHAIFGIVSARLRLKGRMTRGRDLPTIITAALVACKLKARVTIAETASRHPDTPQGAERGTEASTPDAETASPTGVAAAVVATVDPDGVGSAGKPATLMRTDQSRQTLGFDQLKKRTIQRLIANAQAIVHGVISEGPVDTAPDQRSAPARINQTSDQKAKGRAKSTLDHQEAGGAVLATPPVDPPREERTSIVSTPAKSSIRPGRRQSANPATVKTTIERLMAAAPKFQLEEPADEFDSRHIGQILGKQADPIVDVESLEDRDNWRSIEDIIPHHSISNAASRPPLNFGNLVEGPAETKLTRSGRFDVNTAASGSGLYPEASALPSKRLRTFLADDHKEKRAPLAPLSIKGSINQAARPDANASESGSNQPPKTLSTQDTRRPFYGQLDNRRQTEIGLPASETKDTADGASNIAAPEATNVYRAIISHIVGPLSLLEGSAQGVSLNLPEQQERHDVGAIGANPSHPRDPRRPHADPYRIADAQGGEQDLARSTSAIPGEDDTDPQATDGLSVGAMPGKDDSTPSTTASIEDYLKDASPADLAVCYAACLYKDHNWHADFRERMERATRILVGIDFDAAMHGRFGDMFRSASYKSSVAKWAIRTQIKAMNFPDLESALDDIDGEIRISRKARGRSGRGRPGRLDSSYEGR